MENRYEKAYNIRWFDFYINEEELKKMLPYQKINHFPCSASYSFNFSVGKKNNLGKHLKKL